MTKRVEGSGVGIECVKDGIQIQIDMEYQVGYRTIPLEDAEELFREALNMIWAWQRVMQGHKSANFVVKQ